MNDEQRRLAEENHNLVHTFIWKNKLNDDWYDIVIFGYLRGIMTWEPSRGSIANWLFNNMRYSMLKEFDRRNKKEVIDGEICYVPIVSNVEYLDELNSKECNTFDIIDRVVSIENMLKKFTYMQLSVLELKIRGYTIVNIGKSLGISHQQIANIWNKILKICDGAESNRLSAMRRDRNKYGKEEIGVMRARCKAALSEVYSINNIVR